MSRAEHEYINTCKPQKNAQLALIVGLATVIVIVKVMTIVRVI